MISAELTVTRATLSRFRALADIAAARQDWKSAYAAWRKMLEIDPKTHGAEERMQDLKRRAEGEET